MTYETEEKKSAKSAAHGSPKKASMSMSNDDHTSFVDLLLQQAAQSATAAMGIVDPKAQFDATAQAIARTDAALAGYTVPETGTNSKQLFRSVDGVFMALYELYYDVDGSNDILVKTSAEGVKRVMRALNQRFEPFGWKVPKPGADSDKRAKEADKAGATVLTTSEKGQLGRLHLRAARQYVMGSWEQIVAGNLGAIAIASHNLADAMSLLVDPHLSSEMAAITSEVTATEEVVSRLVMTIEEHNSSKLTTLRDLGKQLDGLRKLVGKEPRWSERVGPSAQKAGSEGDAKNDGGKVTPPPNDRPHEPPNADPPMHKSVETRHWTKKVHIKDTNYVDEYLGYVELHFEAMKTPSGQVYIVDATATKILSGRGRQYLSVGASVRATSVDLNGDRYADVYFDVQIGGPNKTETESVSVGGKGSAGNEDKTRGAELSAQVTFSKATSSQGTAAFRRVFRVSSLNEPTMRSQADPKTNVLRQVPTEMAEAERLDLHRDFDDFELDDDDVGDSLTTFYADWVLHSYSD